MSDDFKQRALQYHRSPVPGKISVTPTKMLANQFDLSLAYSPGVAHACNAIVDDPNQASDKYWNDVAWALINSDEFLFHH